MTDTVRREPAGTVLDAATRSILDAISGPAFVTDAAERFVYWNPAAEALCGWTETEVIGRPRSQILVAGGTENTGPISEALRSGNPREDRFEIRRHDGTTATALVTEKAVLDEHGHVSMVLGLARDLAPRKRMEQRLARTELWSKSAFENSVLGIAFADLEGRLTNVNPAMCAIFERDAGDLIGRFASAFNHPDEVEPSVATLRELGTGKRSRFSAEKRILTPSGRVVWVQIDLVGVPGTDGQAEYLFGQVREVTEQHQASAALGAGQARWEAVVGDLVDSVAATVEMRDPYTARHQASVAGIAVAIARRLGLDEESCRGLSIAGRMHDVGKMAIPMDILSKPGRLLPAEYELVKLHPALGAAVIARIDFPWPVATMIRQHHERLDGSGYPDGLGGADLLPESRILAVADVAEASASHRPYRPALGTAGALEIIREASRRGTLDETAVNACIELVLSGELEFEQ